MNGPDTKPATPLGRATEVAGAYHSGEIDLDTFCNRFIRLAENLPRGEPDIDAYRLTAARLDSIRFSLCAAEQPAAVSDVLAEFRRMTQNG